MLHFLWQEPIFAAGLREFMKENRAVGELAAIGLLLAVVVVVFLRLPKIELGHKPAFRTRRFLNWLPLGLTYAMLYMGRYNLTVSKSAFEEMTGSAGGSLMGNEAFGTIFGVGVVIYGMSFLLNGPLTDRFGGKWAILVGAGGSAVCNLLMGLGAWTLMNKGAYHAELIQNFTLVYSLLYGLNMYFQSFGAVAIVKVNAHWFHVRERGVFGAIFGVLISLGIYFAFDVSAMILGKDKSGLDWVFFTPAAMLGLFWIIELVLLRNTPGEAGYDDFDTADASSGDDGPRLGAVAVFKLMLMNPIIMTIAGIEFCSGFLRQAIMQWFRTFAKQTDGILGLKSSFVYEHWGMLLCCAGIMGGVFAGTISDHLFQSRRGPVAAVLYGLMIVGAAVLCFGYQIGLLVGPLVIVMSMAVIGVHGMLSGTASMDFGGKKNVGVAVGIIDGFVYLGTGVMSFTYGAILPQEQLVDGELTGPATDPANWINWPIAMVPVAIIGFLFALRVWNARPSKAKAQSSAADEPGAPLVPEAEPAS